MQVKLFHFSEDEQLDMRKVDEAINENEHAQASVLLLATGSSHLWFDPEHNPRNLELCTTLKNPTGWKDQFRGLFYYNLVSS